MMVAINPKTVITATAYAVSSSLALITGLVATIAETPQIEVPTAIMSQGRRIAKIILNILIIMLLEATFLNDLLLI